MKKLVSMIILGAVLSGCNCNDPKFKKLSHDELKQQMLNNSIIQ